MDPKENYIILFQKQYGIKYWIFVIETLNSVCLSRGQSDVRPPGQRRRTPTAFLRVSTGDSDMPSSCDMKDEPEFKQLQGNWSFFFVRASQGPFHLRQKTQGPSHIPTAEGKLLLRCLWKVGSPLHSRQGISSQLVTIWGAWSFPWCAVLKLIFI